MPLVCLFFFLTRTTSNIFLLPFRFRARYDIGFYKTGHIAAARFDQADLTVAEGLERMVDKAVLAQHNDSPNECPATSYKQMVTETPENCHNVDEVSSKGKQLQEGKKLVPKHHEVTKPCLMPIFNFYMRLTSHPMLAFVFFSEFWILDHPGGHT